LPGDNSAAVLFLHLKFIPFLALMVLFVLVDKGGDEFGDFFLLPPG